MVDRIRRRRVNLRVTVTEQEIDRYLEQNREKLETGLTFEARHILFIPDPNRGEDGWEGGAPPRRRRLRSRAGRRRIRRASPRSCRRTAPASDGGSLGTMKRGELARGDRVRHSPPLRRGDLDALPLAGRLPSSSDLESRRSSLAGDGASRRRAHQIRDILLPPRSCDARLQRRGSWRSGSERSSTCGL